jgi:ribonuclease HI
MTNTAPQIQVFTDGSCHTQKLVGAWVALFYLQGEKKILQGVEYNTTHHRMELTAVLQALYFLKDAGIHSSIEIITDSQYVTGLIPRRAALTAKNFITKAGNKIANDDLLVSFYNMLDLLDVSFIKVKAHQYNAGVPLGNEEVDQLSRSLVRDAVRLLG